MHSKVSQLNVISWLPCVVLHSSNFIKPADLLEFAKRLQMHRPQHPLTLDLRKNPGDRDPGIWNAAMEDLSPFCHLLVEGWISTNTMADHISNMWRPFGQHFLVSNTACTCERWLYNAFHSFDRKKPFTIEQIITNIPITATHRKAQKLHCSVSHFFTLHLISNHYITKMLQCTKSLQYTDRFSVCPLWSMVHVSMYILYWVWIKLYELLQVL